MANKYHNRKITTAEGTFDSKKELERWHELKLLQSVGRISDLRRQAPFVLISSQKGKDGKTIERPVTYYADFVYTSGGETVVEDTKGVKTPEYIIKRKLMLWVYGIRIREV